MMTMRNSYKNMAVLLGVLACGLTVQANPKKPNVLLIVLDDAGFNDFGFMGSKDIKSPRIDQLSQAGVIFTDAHVSASVSGPSRSGILTGKYQQRFGCECNLGGDLGLALDQLTIADIFKQNDYTTACIGKWHQGNGPAYHPNKRGFDHFYGFIAGSRSYFFQPKSADLAGNPQNLQLNGQQQLFDSYLTDVLAQGAINFFEQNNQKPFMMYLAFNAVHTPMEATEADKDLFPNHPRQKLAAMTWAVDRAIGEVVDYLDKKGELANTLIVFLSDNGGDFSNNASNYPLKGFKGNKYEGGHKVPFFMVWGNKIKSGSHFSGLSSSLDILPTTMDAAGIKLKSHATDGVNLLPYINGAKKGNPHDQLFWRKDKMAATRLGNYKLVRVLGEGERLYNLSSDPQESIDLSKTETKMYTKISQSLVNWEKQMMQPLWLEGDDWNEVVLQIHRDLMNNREVKVFSPWDLRKPQNTPTENQ